MAMDLVLKKHNIEYPDIFLLSIMSGFFISQFNFSVLIIIGIILFIAFSIRYFNNVLLLIIFYIPFQIALNISSGIDLASGRVFVLYIFVIWVFKSFAEKKLKIVLRLQTIIIIFFLFLAVFSMLQAWDDERAFRKILVFLSIFPIYFVITSREAEKYVYKILDALLIGGFIISLLGIAQFLMQFIIGIDPLMELWSKVIAPMFYGNEFGAEVVSNPSWLVNIGGVTIMRAISLFPDPHMFSFYLGLLIPIIFSFVLIGKDKNKDGIIVGNGFYIYLFFIVMVLAELLTFSRGGYIGLIAGLGILAVLSWKYMGILKKILLLVFFSIFSIYLLFFNQPVVNRLLSSFDFSEGSNIERIKNWRQGMEVFDSNFLWGVGIGNYSMEIDPSRGYRTPIYAHNTYLDIGSEMGIFSLLAWLALILVTIFELYFFSEKTFDISKKTLSLGLISSFAWFSIHGFFDTPIFSPTVLSIFMIIVSLAIITTEIESEEQQNI